MRFGDLPGSAQWYVGGICMLAVVLAALAALQPGAQAPLELLAMCALAAAIAHSFPVSTPSKQTYHVSLPLLIAALILLSPLQLVALLGFVHLAEWLRRRNSITAQLFNAAAYTVTGLMAQAAYRALWPAAGDLSVDIRQPAFLVAGLGAAVIFALLNRCLVGVAIWFGNRISPQDLHLFETEGLLRDLVLLLMGVPLAHLVVMAPWAAAIGAAPLWLIHRVLDLPNLRSQSRQDDLTGLFSATYLTESCTHELNRARRFNRPLSLLLLDLDGLGQLTAAHGTHAGDDALCATARTIGRTIREYDLPARVGGGLFAVLLPETDLAQAQDVAERIRRDVAARRLEVPNSVELTRLTVSVGGAVLAGGTGSAAQLFEAARTALERARHDGGNQIEFVAIEAKLAKAAPPSVGEPGIATLVLGEPERLAASRVRAVREAECSAAPRIGASGEPGPSAAPPVRPAGEAECSVAPNVRAAGFHSLVLEKLGGSRAAGFLSLVLLRTGGSRAAAGGVQFARSQRRWSAAYRRAARAGVVVLAAILLVFGLLWSVPTLDWRLLAVLFSVAALAGLTFHFKSLSVALALAIELHRSPARLWLARYWRLWPLYLALGATGLLVGYAYTRFGLIGAIALAAAALLFRQVAGQYVDRTLESVRTLRTANEQLEHQAFHDPLTSLANRTLFSERLERAMVRSVEGSVAVLYLDLDNFKIVNDTFGHASGDALLLAATDRIRECVRREDTIARLGGDEFTVLLEDMRDPSDAVRMAERIGESLAQSFALAGQEVFVSASIGIAVDTDRSHKPDDLMREADMAMYRAKSGGKARYEIFDTSQGTLAMERLELETELRNAADRGQLTLHYLPVVDLLSGNLDAVEAVLRWRHPRRGLVAALEFMAVAEQTGIVLDLGKWSLNQACRDAAAWQVERPGVVVQVNLSTLELQRASLVEFVAEALAAADLPASCLRLEIPERSFAGNTEATADVLGALQAMGVRIALDDVGDGTSSLAWLSRSPVDTLKIGAAASDSPALVRASVALGHALGMTVTAQGVDTVEQAVRLAALGCRHGQGELYGDPRTAASLADPLAVRVAARAA